MGQQRKMLLLDLDRTLIRTDVLNSTVHTAIAGQYPITIAQLHDEAPNYFVRPDTTDPSAYYYPLFQHLKEGHNIAPDEVRQIIGCELLDTEFMYDDVPVLLKALEHRDDIEKRILTFGDPPSQELKYNLCPALGSLVMICMQTPDKGIYIRTNTTEDDYVMIVDDKIVRDLPSWCTGVHIDRTTEQEVTLTDYGYTINTLAVVPDLIDQVFPR